MGNTNTATDERPKGESIVLILLGTVSGVLSIGILFGYFQANEWLSPILGVVAILLLMSGGLIGGRNHESRHR